MCFDLSHAANICQDCLFSCNFIFDKGASYESLIVMEAYHLVNSQEQKEVM
jgi:hypothetical protein